jgi:class 3 adenylate cyclase
VSGRPCHTFLFAHIAGFTALTEAHGDEEAADLAESFSDEVSGAVARSAASTSRPSAMR